jgi:hypothetical protein
VFFEKPCELCRASIKTQFSFPRFSPCRILHPLRYNTSSTNSARRPDATTTPLVGDSVADFAGIAISLDEQAIHNPSLRSIGYMQAGEQAENQRVEHFQSRKAGEKLNYTLIDARHNLRDHWGKYSKPVLFCHFSTHLTQEKNNRTDEMLRKETKRGRNHHQRGLKMWEKENQVQKTHFDISCLICPCPIVRLMPSGN